MMEMLKSKIKLNFKILFLFILTNIVFSQGIFIHHSYKNVLSYSAFYSKHEKFKDYNYGLTTSSVWKGKFQLDLAYSKSTQYFSEDKKEWNEFSSISIKYYIKPNQILNYSLSTTSSIATRDSKSSKSSFSLMINSKLNQSLGTGMTYYPYIKLMRVFDGNYFDVIKDINNTDLFIYKDFYELGFFVSFNDMWLRPYFLKESKRSSMFSGLEIGFCYY